MTGPMLPLGAIAWLVGRFSVATPDATIAAEVRQRCTGDGWTPALVAAAVAYALEVHAENRELYREVMA